MDWDDFDAALLDLDGVITPTADVHMCAWQQMFSEYLGKHGLVPAYRDQDYFDFLDGKPRYDGVRSLLGSREVVLPDGEPGDPDDAETVCGLGNRKNTIFAELLNTDGVEPYPGSITLLDMLDERGIATAVVSSSRNARAVLRAAGQLERFEVVVDGTVAADKGLAGKPMPDTFWHAAQQLGVDAKRAVVFEDAASGVAAGRAGEFGFVIGVDRGAGRAALTSAGADMVIDDLAEVADP